MDKPIMKFRNNERFLSNFFVEPDGTTVEQDFQAEKTFDLQERVEILIADGPAEAKRLGQKCTLREDWPEVRIGIMRHLVLRKFLDHRELAVALFQTGDAELVEGNTWHDNLWGDCSCDSCEGKVGENHLGHILMEIRDLINSYNDD